MYIKVVAKPSSRRERVLKISDTEFHIDVKEPAERNMANKRIREIVALQHQIMSTKVRLLTGHRSRVKILVVEV